jgi:hypothetical protein
MDLRIGTVVFDCTEPARLAEFWCAVMGYEVRDTSDRWVTIDGSPSRPLAFQRVPEGKLTKNRLHLDLYTRDVETEVQRCLSIGARRLWMSEDPDDVFVVLADPEGNEFCICLNDTTPAEGPSEQG